MLGAVQQVKIKRWSLQHPNTPTSFLPYPSSFLLSPSPTYSLTPMNTPSPRTVYHNLRLLEQVNAATSAVYRQLAQEVIADPNVDMVWRQAIANRLHQANHQLGQKTVSKGDSY